MKFALQKVLWGVIFLSVVGRPAVAAETGKVVPVSAAQVTLSYAPIVKMAAPAVVNIYTRKVVNQRVLSPFLADPFFQQFFGGDLMPEGMTRQRLENALGSGVIVSKDGLVVTSNHVIKGADEITVVLADRHEFDAKLVTSDPRADLAFLRIDPKGEALPYLALRDSDEAEVGDLVLAIGNPFGVGQTVTTGIVSALARTSADINDLNYFIQTDAAINPGNSGGALVTMDGRLLGINTAIYSRSGGSMGIGFAVPSNMVRTMMTAAQAGQKNVVRAWTGIKGQDVTAELAASIKVSPPSGMLVNAIHAASPARKAGLKVGDVVLAVNGKAVADTAAFRYRVATLEMGQNAEIQVVRAGQKLTLNMAFGAPPENPMRQETTLKGRHPFSGALIANLSPAVIEEKQLEDGVEDGVVILGIAQGSYAAQLGLRVGDLIVSVNGADVASVEAVQEAVQSHRSRWQIVLSRKGRQLQLMVGG